MRNYCRISNALIAALGVAGAGTMPNAAAQVVPPEMADGARPDAPSNRFGGPLDGWVVVRYAVLADGSTDAVAVVDKMPPQLNHRDVVSAVESWEFVPATADGEPIEWHNNEAVIVFQADFETPGPTQMFVQAYQEAAEVAEEGDFEDALRSNERMLSTATTRLEEIGLALVQNANFHLQLGDAHAAYAAIARATDLRVPSVQGDDLRIALQYRNALELQLGDLFGALETYRRRNELEPVPGDDLVAVNVANIEQALADGGTIVHKAKILDDAWRHELDRRTFAITQLSGAIEGIRVECDRRATELEYAADAEWSLPESWGSCVVAVQGRDDTEFEFYEFQ